ncbi:coiled-coil domain-containing protein 114 isoform X1 [Simochromis diagramma]|uniref:coiled-coil domain-containing protein 114 isoform X1 n=1 Tax=Simochromis diagramma TaxID=43689 RepID=UPI001A7EAA79|nr:coiled-coil domain-containing protein 114 isoform X1 [Simochromis diagramma]
MPRGRSAASARSDNSEVDVDGAVEEIAKLQRQFRIMEGDLQAYNMQTRKQIRKQQQEIEVLQKEQEELQRNLGACNSLARQQQENKDIQTIQVLLEQREMLEEELQKGKKCQQELKKEISSMESKLAELRNGAVSNSNTQSSPEQRIQKSIRTMEYKLNRALTRLNEQLTKNSQVREELHTLYIERVRFQQLHNRLSKELQEVRKKIGEVINQSSAAYDTRVEAHAKATMIKEKALKDRDQYSTELKELERVIAHESTLKTFMIVKCSDAGRQDDEHEMGPGQSLEPKEPSRMDSGEESLDALEEAFERIRIATGEENLDQLVTRYIQVEDRNFALFNFVNEQTNEAEALKEQISKIKQDMEQFRVKGLQQERQHRSLLQDIDKQLEGVLSQRKANENRASIISEILDKTKTGVNNIFTKVECDRSAIEDMLGSSSGITENNIMSYLSLVEQKTNELLTVQAFLSTKDLEDPASFPLGQNPKLLQQNISIQPAVNRSISVAYNAEESPVTDEEERPLSQGELRQRIMKGVLEKEFCTTDSNKTIKDQSAVQSQITPTGRGSNLKH